MGPGPGFTGKSKFKLDVWPSAGVKAAAPLVVTRRLGIRVTVTCQCQSLSGRWSKPKPGHA
eukprot:2035859-Rhodomonas_salina.1